MKNQWVFSLRFCHGKVTIVHEGYKVFKLMMQIRKLLTFILEVLDINFLSA